MNASSLLLPIKRSNYSDLKQNKGKIKLRKGFSSGPFAPAREESADDARKMAILEEWRYSYQKLEKSLQSYTDEQMRQNQFYHPMLGRITLMETAYIALYHSIHHLQNVERKTGLKLLPE